MNRGREMFIVAWDAYTQKIHKVNNNCIRVRFNEEKD